MAESFIYVIAYDQEGPVKIGFSKSPEKRLRALQTGSHHDLKLYYVEAFDEDVIKMVESILHKDHNHRRAHGEWFNMTVGQAISELQFRAMHQHVSPASNSRRRRVRE